MRPWTVRRALLGSAGLTLIIFGAALYLLRHAIFGKIVNNVLSLTPNSKAYEMWRDTDKMNTYLDIYFFNWTNPEDLLDLSKKPNLVQLGPYSFRERREKVNIVFHPENDTVSYQQRRTWFLDKSRSNGSLDDKICELNVVAVSAAEKTRFWPYMMQQSLSYMLDQFSSKYYVVKTVDELLFTGFEDHLISMGRMSGLDDTAPPFDRFGWFYERNGSTMFDGTNNMATGVNDIENLGKVLKWNYQNATNYYESPCNAIEGSAGEFWPPYRTTEDIRLFTPDICRPVTYEFEKEVVYKGIQGYKFALGKKTLSNDTRRHYPHQQFKYVESMTTAEGFSSADPTVIKPQPEIDRDFKEMNEGKCYCNGECSPMGVLNITACRYGAPGFISLPHFNRGDKVLASSFTGLQPVDDKHSFYITLEPTTGIPIDVAARLQVNILLRPSKSVVMFKDVPTLYFPMFWFEMKVGIPDDMFTQNKPNGVDMSQVKTEVVYMDKAGTSEDTQTRTDRRLHPKL
ncbi:protein croquemort isoform X2 [Copidosoma floridanum]|uniref:protein croquemort isoform X2 n=1 Tax=Copidosoma floridanum TaxID=29053 RepID=UPI0006C9BD17|nr:protein croquemort isoform X2 [Copidosoma floridanum]